MPPRSSPRKAKSLATAAGNASAQLSTSTVSSARKRKSAVEAPIESAVKKEPSESPKKARPPAKTARKRKAKEEDEDKDAKPSKTTKKAKADDSAVLAARTDVSTLKHALYIGAHVSSAGGVQNALPNAEAIGANAFALFLKSQRKWQNPPLAAATAAAFREACGRHGYDAGAHCLPHGSYLVNLAQPDADKAQQALDAFVDDLRRCAALGIRLYNFHPGADVGSKKKTEGDRTQALARIAAALNAAHRATAPSAVVTVLENMAGQGATVGDRFADLRAVIDGVEDKARVGVCLDTCHAFAAGYDLRTPASLAAVLAEFDRVVGLAYLRAWHLNDSKAPLGSRRDLHANIGTGFLGLRAFHALLNHHPDAVAGRPLVLETPIDRPGPGGTSVEDRQVWADEIKLLESLVGMDPDSDAFRAKEAALQAQGAAERQRIQAQVDKRK